MNGNPSPNTPPTPQTGGWYERYKRWYWAHVLHRFPVSRRARIVNYAKASLAYAGKMHYTEGPQRSELFHKPHGHFKGAHADCSQFSASIAHWSGVKSVDDADWTGTLCHKGTRIREAEPGAFVFFGADPFVHMAVMVSKTSAIGFGSQSAPDQSSLAGLLAYFASKGHPGYEFRDLTR